MRESAYAYLFDDSSFTAGFTKPILTGDAQNDTKKALSAEDGEIRVAHMKQPHGNDVKFAFKEGVYDCDGIFTNIQGLALVVRTADCMPLIFYSKKEAVVGVVHMGWRSAKCGILDAVDYDLSSFRCIAGPGMRKCCYEVGKEFRAYQTMIDFLETKEERYFFDPINFALRGLSRKGLREENFFDVGICSHCSDLGFYSYRRDGTANRTLSFIVKSSN